MERINATTGSYNFIDLFAGAGGLSEGFIQAGFSPVAHVEMNPYAAQTLETRTGYYYLKAQGKIDIYNDYISGKITRDEFLQHIPEEQLQSVFCETMSNETLPRLFENIDKYTEVEKEYQEIMKKYENDLTELAQYHDSQIVMGYIKILEEELKQKKILAKLFYAKQEENLARERVDNSDDQISEKIYDMEEEIAKSEQKIRRTKTTIKKRILQKEDELTSLFETREKGIQKESIKGPKIFNKATRFFLGKLNPTKQIQRNVFNNLKKRIDEYEKNKIEIKIKDEYAEENIAKTLEKITTKD